MTFNGKKLKLIRKLNGERQKDLAKLCGVGRSMIANLETGYVDPDTPLLSKILEHYKLPSAYFQDNSDYPVSDASISLENFYIKERMFICPTCGERFSVSIHYNDNEACFKCFRKIVENLEIEHLESED